MKTATVLLALGCILLIGFPAAFAQEVGDYQSNGSGGGFWSTAATWQTFNGSTWTPAGSPPTGTQFITVQSLDSVYIDVPVSIADTLRNRGKLGGTTSLTIGSTGTFQHDEDGGSLPRATWSTGSTLLMTGNTGLGCDNRNQSYFNVAFDTPGLLSNLNMGWDSVTIGGNIYVINTGSARWQMAAPTAGDSAIFSVMGDIIVTGGQFSSNGTSNANTKIVVNQYGSIIVTGGNLSVSRGSQGSGTGSTRWYLHEGNFSMSNGTTQNSNPTNARFVFDKAGTQTLTLGAGNTLTALPIEVSSVTTFDMGVNMLRGSGMFMLDPGATLVTANTGGLDSAISITGTLTLSTESNYTFNGTDPQVTGVNMPTTVADLTIDNPTTVTLTQHTTINDTLHLKAGVFNVGAVGYSLGPNGFVAFEGGSITTVESNGDGIPAVFFVEQNYPNPFNPSTTIRYGLPASSTVSIKVFSLVGQEVATLFDGRLGAGVHTVSFDGAGLASGVYFCRIAAGPEVAVRRMVLMK